MRDYKPGFVRVIEERVAGGKTRFRTRYEGKKLHKKLHRLTHLTWDDAVNTADALNRKIREGKGHVLEDEDLHTLKDLKEQLILIEKLAPPYRRTKRGWHEVVNAGITAVKSIDSINQQRVNAGLRALSDSEALHDWQIYEGTKLLSKNRLTFSQYIDKCLKEKKGAHGSETNEELGDGSKEEWERLVGLYLRKWIGEAKPVEGKKTLQKRIIDGINFTRNAQRGKRNAKPWAQRTKKAAAVKASEFGKWLVGEEVYESNPFEGLAKEFRSKSKGKETGGKEVVILTVEQVKKVFEVASRPEHAKTIPYFSLLFFGGLRSEEAAGYKKRKGEKFQRRLSWEQFEGWKSKSKVTGGVKFLVPPYRELPDGSTQRASKIEVSRYADLTPAGVAWIKWYFRNFKSSGLPTRGEVEFKPKWRVSVLEEAGLKPYPYDGINRSITRHCYTSYAHQNINYLKKLGQVASAQTYWIECCGHEQDVFRKYYKREMPHEECVAYFNIFPPKEKDSDKAQE